MQVKKLETEKQANGNERGWEKQNTDINKLEDTK